MLPTSVKTASPLAPVCCQDKMPRRLFAKLKYARSPSYLFDILFYMVTILLLWSIIHIHHRKDCVIDGVLVPCPPEMDERVMELRNSEPTFQQAPYENKNVFRENEIGYKTLDETAKLLDEIPLQSLAGLRVCFVTGGFRGPTMFGGIGASFYREVDLFRSYGANITVLFTAMMKGVDKWVDYFKKENLTFVPLPAVNPAPYGSIWMTRSFVVFRWLRFKQTNFDVIFFHDIYGLALYTLYAKRTENMFTNVPIVIHGHGASKLSDHFNARPPKDHNTLVTYFMEQKAIEMADFVTVPTNFYADWMVENSYKIQYDRVMTLQNMVESSLQRKPFNTPGTIKFSRHFCFFSRLDALKGVFFIVQTLHRLLQDERDLPEKFSFIGDAVMTNVEVNGDIVSQKSDLILKNKLSDLEGKMKYHFFTNFTTLDALSYMHDTNCILIVPSFGETASLVLYESIMMGLPVLHSDIPPITDQLDGNLPPQYRFKPGDVDTLANVIETALTTGVPVQKVRIGPKKARELYVKMLLYMLNNKHIQVQHMTGIPKYFVTVIITSHNRPETLQPLLLALLQQTYRYFKVLVVDCSTNNDVVELVNKLASTFADTSVVLNFHKMEQAYVSKVRNVGFSLIDTPYGLLIDDDDIPVNNMVEKMTMAAIRTNADVISGFAANFAEESSGSVKPVRYSLAVGEALQAELYFHYAGKSNMLIRKEAYLAVGGCTEVPAGEESPYVDWDLYVKLMLHNYRLEILPEVTFQYRLNSKGSIYYNNEGMGRKTYNGHLKIINNFCKFHKLNQIECDTLKYAKFALSLPKIKGV